MSVMFPANAFPSKHTLRRGAWAPVLFAPNPDSSERLVIAVVAVTDGEFHIAAANAGKRLHCLFGPAASTALMVQEAAVASLRAMLVVKGRQALAEPTFPVSGISLGAVRVGEAPSMQALAESWLEATSSLHLPPKAVRVDNEDEVGSAVDAIEAQADNDRLPLLVYRQVEQADPRLADFFSADIRNRSRKSRAAPQKVFIGFAGQHVVANFATLKPTRARPMIDHIKRLILDLAQHQEDEAGRIAHRRVHEMIVFHRDDLDPEYDDRHHSLLTSMMEDLWAQGSKFNVQVQPRTSVAAIAKHVQTVERTGIYH